MSSDLNFIEYSSREALVRGVSAYLVASVQKGLDRRLQVAMSLSGGQTPMPIYAQMAQSDLNWDRVVAIPTDERWVARGHPSNNAQQIRQHLNGHGPKVLDLVPPTVEGEPQIEYAQEVLMGLPSPFAVSVVGMGQDAHFASLFPNHEALSVGLNPHSPVEVLSLTPDPLPLEAPFGRVSLTLSKLLASDEVALLITGTEKRQVLDRAWNQVLHGVEEVTQCPIAALLGEARDRLVIHWSE